MRQANVYAPYLGDDIVPAPFVSRNPIRGESKRKFPFARVMGIMLAMGFGWILLEVIARVFRGG